MIIQIRNPFVRLKDKPVAAPVAVSETKGLQISNVHNWGVSESAGGKANYSQPFKNHPYVYRAISVIANAAGAVEWKLARRLSNGKNQDVTTGLEYELLQRPSRYASCDMFFSQIAGWLQMAPGECFVRIIRVGTARRLVFLSPECIEVKLVGDKITYEYTSPGTHRPEILPEEDVIHFKTAFNPYDPLRGIGPLQAAACAYQDDLDVRKYNRESVRAGGMLAGFLDTSESGAWPTEDQLEAFRETIKKMQRENVKVAIAPGKWQQAGQTPEEMAYIELRKLSFKEVCGVFGVPPQLAGDFERDQADAWVQMVSFHVDTMRPLYRLIANTFTLNIWKIKGTSPLLASDLFLYVDDSQVPAVAELTQKLRATDAEQLAAGLATRNEIRERRGEPPLPGGDVATVPFGLVPLESVRAFDDPAPDDEPEEDDDDKAIDDDLECKAVRLQSIPFENAIVKALEDVWDQVEREIVAKIGKKELVHIGNGNGNRFSLEERDDESILARDPFNVDKVAKLVAEKTTPILRGAQFSGGTRGLRLARRQSMKFQVDAKPAQQQLARQIQRFAVPVTETTWKRVQDTLIQGLGKGEPEAKLTERVRHAMGVRRSEAQNTAVTEVGAALNGGTFLGYQQSGVVIKHRWLRGSANSRPDHKDAHGQTVKVGDAFRVGGELLLYPGDPSASAEQVCNCACSTVPAEIRA